MVSDIEHKYLLVICISSEKFVCSSSAKFVIGMLVVIVIIIFAVFFLLDVIDKVPHELWMEFTDIVQEIGSKTICKKREMQKSKMAV